MVKYTAIWPEHPADGYPVLRYEVRIRGTCMERVAHEISGHVIAAWPAEAEQHIREVTACKATLIEE